MRAATYILMTTYLSGLRGHERLFARPADCRDPDEENLVQDAAAPRGRVFLWSRASFSPRLFLLAPGGYAGLLILEQKPGVAAWG